MEQLQVCDETDKGRLWTERKVEKLRRFFILGIYLKLLDLSCSLGGWSVERILKTRERKEPILMDRQ